MKTDCYLLRHADHGHVGRMLTGRMPGIALSETGRAQAKALARRMAEHRIDALFCSPQARTRQTAEILSPCLGVEAQISPALDEIDFGHWAGRSFAALQRDPEWQRWNAERDTASTPAGETMSGVARRLTGFLERLRYRFPGGAVCLVSHSDLIRSAICHYRGRPFQDVHTIEISPASITTLVLDERGAEIQKLNDCAHLTQEVVH